MRAVNLIPADERRGAGGAAGRTGGAAYILLGALALLVVMFAAYATTSRSINTEQAKRVTLERDAAAGEAKAAALAPYISFAALRAARVATVQSIADSRFDWAHAMHELGRTLPEDITLTALNGSVSTTASGTNGGVALRAAYNVPAIELNGCAPGQASIPPMLSALRRVDGVRRVALQQSIKAAVAAASTPIPGVKVTRPADCRRTFQAVVFFDAKTQPVAAAVPAPGAAVPVAGAPGTAQNVDGGAK